MDLMLADICIIVEVLYLLSNRDFESSIRHQEFDGRVVVALDREDAECFKSNQMQTLREDKRENQVLMKAGRRQTSVEALADPGRIVYSTL
jgi:hypothetical protein